MSGDGDDNGGDGLNRKQIAVWVVVGLLVFAGTVAVAETFTGGFGFGGAGGGGDALQGPEVVIGTDGWEFAGGQPATNHSINVSTKDNGWMNVSAPQDGPVVTVDQLNGTWSNVSDISSPNTNVTFQPSDKKFTRVQGSLDELKWKDPAVEDGQVDLYYDASSSGADIVVETDGTPGEQYGLVDVDENEGLASGVADSNGVVRFDNVPTGEHTVEIQELGSVYIRNVTEPHDQIDNAEVEILISGSDQTVDIQTVNNGVINMTGLPIDESYIFIVDAPGYHLRSAVVKDISQQETIFLLNDSNKVSVQAAFAVTDLTGQFDSPLLTIDRVINRSIYDSSQPAEYTWTTIGGDRLGADAKLTLDLEKDARYRISIENQEGETRVLGEYTARFNETVNLEVGEITWDTPPSDDYRVAINQTDLTGGNEQIEFQYQDNSENTSELCVTIHERGNTSNVLYPEDCQEDLGTYKLTQPVSGDDLNTTWVVNWSATQAGQAIGSTVPLGQADEISLPIEGRWLGPMVLILLIGLLSAAPKTGARTGAIVVVAAAFGLTWWGWVNIPGPALGIAGALALLGKAADFNKRY